MATSRRTSKKTLSSARWWPGAATRLVCGGCMTSGHAAGYHQIWGDDGRCKRCHVLLFTQERVQAASACASMGGSIASVLLCLGIADLPELESPDLPGRILRPIGVLVDGSAP